MATNIAYLASGDPLVSKRHIASLFGVTERTIEVWVRDRGLPRYKLRSGLVRFRLSEVEEWSGMPLRGQPSEGSPAAREARRRQLFADLRAPRTQQPRQPGLGVPLAPDRHADDNGTV